MSALQKFQSDLSANLLKELDDSVPSEPDNVVSAFDFTALLDALLGVLLDFLNACLASNTPAEASEQIASLGPVQRWALRRNIRQSDIPKSQRQAAYEAAVTTLRDTPPDEIKAGVEEFRSLTVDWGLE